MHGRYYTWAGSGNNHTFEKLDRVLASIEWEHKIPLTMVHAKNRSNSDHTPLLWNTGASSDIKQQPLFKIERGWLIHDGFYDLVADVLQSETSGTTAMENWQN